jgi:hypothetical protein
MFDAERTEGDFKTEEDAAEYLDGLIESVSDLFAVSSEVDGTRQYSRPQQSKIEMRIDRILYPKKKLIDAGWRSGVVGIEIKTSGHPAGPLVAQAEDYMQSVFTFKASGVSVCLNSIYLFPAFSAAGIASSILAQRRIGFASEDRGHLALVLNNTYLLRYAISGDARIGTAPNLNCGMKVGSR